MSAWQGIHLASAHSADNSEHFLLLTPLASTSIRASEMASIPVIDISDSNTDAATELLHAATDSGFLYIKSNEATGISAQDIQRMFALVSLI